MIDLIKNGIYSKIPKFVKITVNNGDVTEEVSKIIVGKYKIESKKLSIDEIVFSSGRCLRINTKNRSVVYVNSLGTIMEVTEIRKGVSK